MREIIIPYKNIWLLESRLSEYCLISPGFKSRDLPSHVHVFDIHAKAGFKYLGRMVVDMKSMTSKIVLSGYDDASAESIIQEFCHG